MKMGGVVLSGWLTLASLPLVTTYIDAPLIYIACTWFLGLLIGTGFMVLWELPRLIQDTLESLKSGDSQNLMG